MNSQILRKITEKTASAEEFIEENHEALSSSRSIVRSCFEFLQKVFLGLMYPFSCVLWAIFWSFSLHPKSSHDKFKTASKGPP